MAFQGAIPVEFGTVFPDGAYAAGKFEMVRDFDRSSGDRVVQQIDKDTGLPLWVVEVIDADEQARQRTVKVKVAATGSAGAAVPGARVAVHGGGVRGPDGHPVRGCLPLPGQRQGQGQVRRPAGLLAEGDRGPCSLPGARPPGAEPRKDAA